MTTHAAEGRSHRKMRAVFVGLGLDDQDAPHRIIHGPNCLIVGGSSETHEVMLETLLRLETELERRGRTLGELPPHELADIAFRIDSPELHQLAIQLEEGLQELGQSFDEATADQLSEMAWAQVEPTSDAGSDKAS